jgi:hypothetical protein
MINKSVQYNNITTSHIATTILLSFVHKFPTILYVRLALSLCAMDHSSARAVCDIKVAVSDAYVVSRSAY